MTNPVSSVGYPELRHLVLTFFGSLNLMNPWFWELRSDGEFLPPEIANFGEGWHDWKGPLQSSPPVGAEIFARELVQNFVDAARDHKRQNPNLQAKPRLVFEFHEFIAQSILPN